MRCDEQMRADIALAILAVEIGQPIKGTSMKEWEAAIEKARKARISELELKKKTIKGAWEQTEIYRILLIAIRGVNISKQMWKRMYEGVFFAVTVIRGVEMRMTPQELADAPVPVDSNGTERWGQRNIKVARSKATPQIDSILSEHTKMMSATELADVNATKSKILKENNPKGSINSLTKERQAIDALNKRLDLSEYLECEHGIEGRKNDIFYRINDKTSNTDTTEKKYVADQVKSAGEYDDGKANFNITVGEILQKLLDGQSVTLIAMEIPNDPEEPWSVVRVVWFLYGKDACEMLKKFDKTQKITPVVLQKAKSRTQFTNEFQSKKYRYNVSEPEECERLRNAKIEFASMKNVSARRETYKFWNCDESQMCANHFKEQLIINAMDERLQVFEMSAKKHVDDNYSKVDVRVILPDGRYSRVQSKMVSVRKCQDCFHMCASGGKPINLLLQIDSLEIYYAMRNWVYSLPARVINPKTGEMEPYLSDEEMSKITVGLSKKWKTKHSKYLCNLNDHDTEVVDLLNDEKKGLKHYIAFQKERLLNRPSIVVLE
jgi:hypothetical protein